MENRMEPEEKLAENGEGEKHELENNNFKKKKRRRREVGGIKTMPFILANEICDRFASTGSHANMISYLTNQLNMPLVKASNTLTNFGGTASFTPLIGALIADSFAGRFWTIIVGSIIYELGLVSITISATLPQLRPPPCPTQENCKEASSNQLWILYLSLLLSSLGSGGIRPCVVTFAADQFDMSKSKVETRKWNFFNWYYFCMGMASLTALTVVVYIQDNVGWGLGLGIPTIAMAISVVAFVSGSPLYRRVKPMGSPLVRLAQVIVAAVKKRKEVAPEDPAMLYENRELDAGISSNGRLLHSGQYKWFDRAAIVTEKDEKDKNSPNLWRLATVHRVEELKCIIRMLPIWAAGILLVTSHSHQHSFVIVQARSMDRHLSPSFQIPPASLSIFSILTVLIGLVLYDRLFVPFARRFTKNPAGITCLQRMGVGFAVNILATIVSALVEIKRKQVAAHHGLLDKPTAVIPISVFWLLPQFCLHGAAEVFMSVGHLEFLYDQSPESMRSTAAALYWTAISIGNYIGTLMVSLIHEYTGKGKKGNWLPDRNLNRGRLENYYWLVSGIQVLNLVYYVICAWFYRYKPLEEVSESNGEGDVELAKESTKENALKDANGNGEVVVVTKGETN
ncbi:protein NRT1/ PTR FAMILY 3.1-like [Rhododendron vialii]|uniref:protein NRT1/ PTR FAMILY 3.1-like n=1 Tax=Rhododendron vialii TaxID=182163 RepID=UPI0026602CC1|nr:protein NRT1/ PTR FAMILY 3.1-like [Rhododendron vialii]